MKKVNNNPLAQNEAVIEILRNEVARLRRELRDSNEAVFVKKARLNGRRRRIYKP